MPPGHPLDLVSELEAERERAESVHARSGVIQVPKQAAPDVVALLDVSTTISFLLHTPEADSSRAILEVTHAVQQTRVQSGTGGGRRTE
ncbi:MAG TPA: hypothetical protein VM818_03785 [Vicinamibacterales bacterium]|nr:hypothetical protein [Vicinamibacterales bacterium]